jgi:hypothetical protein
VYREVAHNIGVCSIRLLMASREYPRTTYGEQGRRRGGGEFSRAGSSAPT